LAKNYDTVIIGSTASDKFFHQISETIPPEARENFKLYSRSYFRNFPGARTGGGPDKTKDIRDNAWKAILKENSIKFQETCKVVDENFRTVTQEFSWKQLKEYVTDERVEVLT
jgi:hypothetical protein